MSRQKCRQEGKRDGEKARMIRRMARHGENIYKRKDGRYEGRYVIGRTLEGKTRFGYVYAQMCIRDRNESGSNRPALYSLL